MKWMLDRFKEEITRKTEGNVKIKIAYRRDSSLSIPDARGDITYSTGDDATERNHAWVDTIDEFRKALFSLPNIKGTEASRVKVALIDDGVNLSSLDMYGGTVKVKGVSCCPPEGRSENPWHCSSTDHGTVLANMIVRVNPYVELYILRVHNVASRSGSRNIFANSAAQAIRTAVDFQVDIISMSWTIKSAIAVMANTTLVGGEARHGSVSDVPTAEQSDVSLLEEAIDRAAKANILMFSSASDDIQTGAMDTLPYRRQPGHILRIGASMALGQRDPHSEDTSRIDFYFPGNQVAEARNPRSAKPVKYSDGSSVGTALAAGLASLVMYCARLVQQRFEERKTQSGMSRNNPFSELVKNLQIKHNMQLALNNIKSPTWKDRKVLPVWAVFGPKAKEIEEAREDGKWDVLEKLVNQLGAGIY